MLEELFDVPLRFLDVRFRRFGVLLAVAGDVSDNVADEDRFFTGERFADFDDVVDCFDAVPFSVVVWVDLIQMSFCVGCHSRTNPFCSFQSSYRKILASLTIVSADSSSPNASTIAGHAAAAEGYSFSNRSAFTWPIPGTPG